MKLEPETRYAIDAKYPDPTQWNHGLYWGNGPKSAQACFRRVKRSYPHITFRLVRETIEREQIAPKQP